MKKYYVYTLSNNGIIFYIGKGTKERMYIHEKRCINGIKSNNNSSLYDKIKSILNNNQQIEYSKIFESDDEIECYKYEESKIVEIGLENLCNLTITYFSKNGLSDRVKLGMSRSEKLKAAIDHKRSDKIRQYYREINTGELNPRYGKINTEEHMIAIKNSLIGVPKTEDHKKKISEALIGIERSKEYGEKMSNSLKNSKKFQEKVKSEEFKNKHRENTKNRHKELITYIFTLNGEEVIFKGSLGDMCKEYNLPISRIKNLRYGNINEYHGWKFVEIINKSFKTN